MAKNFNIATATAVNTISDFHKAYIAIEEAKKSYNNKKTALEAEKEEILEKRATAIAGGMSTDDAIRAYSIEKVDANLRKAKSDYDAEVKPLRKDYNKAIKDIVPAEAYKAYQRSMNVKVEGEVESMTAIATTFLANIGVDALMNGKTKALGEYMNNYARGGRKATKGDREAGKYVSLRSEKQFNELYLLAFIDYAINVRGVYEITADNGIAVKSK